MNNYKELNKKEKKKFLSVIEEIYQTKVPELYNDDLHLFLNKNNNRVYLTNFSNRQIENLLISKEKINNFGLYFATIHSNYRIRLNIEGLRYVKPNINYIILKETKIDSFLAGENLFSDEIEKIVSNKKTEFLIVLYKNFRIGIVSKKDNQFINYIPKSRRIKYNRIF